MTFRTADIAARAYMCRECGVLSLRGDLEKLHAVLDTSAPRVTKECGVTP